MSKSAKTLILWVVLILIFWAIYQIVSQDRVPRERVRLSHVVDLAERGELHSAEIRVADNGVARVFAYTKEGQAIEGEGILSTDVFHRFDDSDVQYRFISKEGGFFQSVLITWLPMIFLLAFFFFFLRQLSGGGKLNFSEMRNAKITSSVVEGRTASFNDVVGADAAKESLRALGKSLANKQKKNNVERPPPGLLLTGAPGTGKSLLVDTLATETKLPVLVLKGPEVIEIFAGIGATRIRDVFEKAKKAAPSIVVIDAIDAFAVRRSSHEATSRSEIEQTLHQLLVSISELADRKIPIGVVATTNRPDLLDPALLQSGRIAVAIEVPLPNEAERAELLRKMTAGLALDPASDPALLTSACEGFTPGQIRAAIDHAAVTTGAGGRIGAEALRRAIDQVRGASELSRSDR